LFVPDAIWYEKWAPKINLNDEKIDDDADAAACLIAIK